VVKLSDEMNKVFKEQPSYDGYEFLANIGGNAGLILGNFMYYKIGPNGLILRMKKHKNERKMSVCCWITI
jgi:hypothetical protein